MKSEILPYSGFCFFIKNHPKTNFCNSTVAFDYFDKDIYGEGTHDFSPGNNQIRFNWTRWDGGWRPQNGSLKFTCHTMIRRWGNEDRFSSVYKRVRYEPNLNINPWENYNEWKQWFP